MSEKTLIFKLLIVFDYLFNVLTGGGFDTCFSTRAHINAERYSGEPRRKWQKIRQAVDLIMLEEDHCKKSYQWELERKHRWIKSNSL